MGDFIVLNLNSVPLKIKDKTLKDLMKEYAYYSFVFVLMKSSRIHKAKYPVN